MEYVTQPLGSCIDLLSARAISPMFQTIYGFDVQQTGYVYVTIR